ncbi:hypothetical protein [Treponema phagedenis]|uniref:Uncharacterized protein n=1 Tax=Treponema phagedenis TaxID=162 RepID=A0AAE6IW18_TREPH|nr:hypothetical protein [Treponema phagedenis]QEJ94317.1 hypothetical protein FUT79_03250 [Treponema phagedenis]QEJ99011.1 hypothetical protein FUT82_14100 [Treponema phagedenis]QEK00276.1 hypothetical protein FUT84_03210 [Treponema phagedenis]QEK07768.1 hypothetical protein FUT80_14315 [Treponema phagedenis]QSH94069.1 hypothetical protein C5O78_03230 [Treponema phagedenis]
MNRIKTEAQIKQPYIKKLLIFFLFYFVFFSLSAEPVSVSRLNLGLNFSKNKTPDSNKKNLKLDADIDFSLRFMPCPEVYADVGFAGEIEDVITFFHPFDEKRSYALLRFFNTSLNFPYMNEKPVSLSIFLGLFDKLPSTQLTKDFLKKKLEPPRFKEQYPAKLFLSQKAIKGLGFNIAGLPSSSVCIGGYFTWNMGTKERQVYNAYLTFGTYSPTVLSYGFSGIQVGKSGENNSFIGEASLLFNPNALNQIYIEFGFGETPFKTNLKMLAKNLYALLEARIYSRYFTAIPSVFAAPVFEPEKTPEKQQDYFIGGNLLLASGELNRYAAQAGVHTFFAMKPTKKKEDQAYIVSVTPFCTIKFLDCLLDARVSITPLFYKKGVSMIEGKISLRKEL